MKKRMLAILMASAMMAGVMAGCGSSDTSSSTSSGDGSTYKIGCSFDYLSDFMANVVDGANDYAADNDNVEVTIQDADFDVAKQLQQVENFVSSGYDAVVIKPVDADACGPIASACQEAGIPLVFVNTEANCDYDTYVGSDHTLSGVLQAEYIAEALGGEGKVAILMGDLMNIATTQRTDGNKSVFDQYPGIEVVSEQEASWMRDEAMTKTENWLNSGMEIDAIIGNNDEMAIGAAMVLEEAGITDILVGGIDASADALLCMEKGTMAVTVFQNAYMQGYTGIESAIRILEGEELPEYIDIPYELVSPDKLEEYIAAVIG